MSLFISCRLPPWALCWHVGLLQPPLPRTVWSRGPTAFGCNITYPMGTPYPGFSVTVCWPPPLISQLPSTCVEPGLWRHHLGFLKTWNPLFSSPFRKMLSGSVASWKAVSHRQITAGRRSLTCAELWDTCALTCRLGHAPAHIFLNHTQGYLLSVHDQVCQGD